MKHIYIFLLVPLILTSTFMLNTPKSMAAYPTGNQTLALPFSGLIAAFGSTPRPFNQLYSNTRWNPMYDFNHDVKIDMHDVGIYCRTYPRIVKVTNNLWQGQFYSTADAVTFNVTAFNADQCVLSFTDSSGVWINVNMTQQGNYYNGSFPDVPGGCFWTIYAASTYYVAKWPTTQIGIYEE